MCCHIGTKNNKQNICSNSRILTVPLQHFLTMESVNSVRYKQCAVIEFLFAEKDSVKNIYKYL